MFNEAKFVCGYDWLRRCALRLVVLNFVCDLDGRYLREVIFIIRKVLEWLV
jgi:hypothetical protein